MSKYLQVAELTPWSSNGEDCPFNCIGCEHFGGVEMIDDHQVEILCNNEEQD